MRVSTCRREVKLDAAGPITTAELRTPGADEHASDRVPVVLPEPYESANESPCADRESYCRCLRDPAHGLLISRTHVRYSDPVPDFPTPEEVENHRRSVAMLTTGQPALNREQALEVLRQLRDAVRELRRRDEELAG